MAAIGGIKNRFFFIYLKKEQLTPQICTLSKISSFVQKIAKIPGGPFAPLLGVDVSIHTLGMLGLKLKMHARCAFSA